MAKLAKMFRTAALAERPATLERVVYQDGQKFLVYAKGPQCKHRTLIVTDDSGPLQNIPARIQQTVLNDPESPLARFVARVASIDPTKASKGYLAGGSK